MGTARCGKPPCTSVLRGSELANRKGSTARGECNLHVGRCPRCTAVRMLACRWCWSRRGRLKPSLLLALAVSHRSTNNIFHGSAPAWSCPGSLPSPAPPAASSATKRCQRPPDRTALRLQRHQGDRVGRNFSCWIRWVAAAGSSAHHSLQAASTAARLLESRATRT